MEHTPAAFAHSGWYHSWEENQHCQDGMTLLDYFASHAPRFPEKFQSSISQPIKPTFYLKNEWQNLYREFYNDEVSEWLHHPETQLIPEELKIYVADYEKKVEQWLLIYEEWNKKSDAQIQAEWAFFYSTIMLEERQKALTNINTQSKYIEQLTSALKEIKELLPVNSNILLSRKIEGIIKGAL